LNLFIERVSVLGSVEQSAETAVLDFEQVLGSVKFDLGQQYDVKYRNESMNETTNDATRIQHHLEVSLEAIEEIWTDD
jgi:hypothetical protein